MQNRKKFLENFGQRSSRTDWQVVRVLLQPALQKTRPGARSGSPHHFLPETRDAAVTVVTGAVVGYLLPVFDGY